MNRNVSRYGLGMAMVAVFACFAGSQAAARGDSVALIGTYSGSAWLEPDFSGAHCEGSGRFTHLGRVSTECDAIFLGYEPMAECAGIGTGWGIPNINRAVVTAANGDQLVLVFNDIACEITPFTQFVGSGQFYVDSEASTGRFAGATGTGHMLVGAVDFAKGVFLCVVAGRITY